MQAAPPCRRFISAALRCLFAAAVLLALAHSTGKAAALYDSGIALPHTADPASLRDFLEKIQQKRLNSGIANFIPYSLLLIKETQDSLNRSDARSADVFAEYAPVLSPDIVPVYAARARQLLDGGKPDIPGLARNIAITALHSLSPDNIEDFSQFLFENSAALAGSILLSFCFITLLVAIANLSRFHHDLRHAVSDSVPSFFVWILVVVLFAAPLALRLSLIWLCAWSLLILFGYLSRSARQVITAYFLLIILALPFLAATMGFAKFMSHDSVLNLIWKANYGYCDSRDTEQLENNTSLKDLREEIFFSLGLVYKRRGSLDLAVKYYEKVLITNPQNFRALINLGNVYFAQNNRDAAVKQYEKATVMSPQESAGAYFNLSRVYQQKFMFTESENALNSAKRLDLNRVSRYLKDFTENYNRQVIDETIPVSLLWEKGYKRFSPVSPLVQDIWRSMAGGLPIQSAPFAFLCLLIAMANLGGNDRIRISVRCKYCGKPICRRCQHATVGSMVCVYCNSLLQKQSKLGYGVREEKMSGIKRYLNFKRIIGFAFGYAVPGAGRFWAGQSIAGAAGMVLFFFLLLKAMIPLTFEGPWDFLLGPRIVEFCFYAALLVAYWATMAISSRRLPTGTMEENIILRILSK